MGWHLGSVTIFVTELSASDKQIIARLQPLGGGTIHQVFGYENEIVKVKAYVVGETDLATLKSYTTTGSTYEFASTDKDYGDFYVSNMSWSRVPAIWQTLTVNCTDPLFIVDLELYI